MRCTIVDRLTVVGGILQPDMDSLLTRIFLSLRTANLRLLTRVIGSVQCELVAYELKEVIAAIFPGLSVFVAPSGLIRIRFYRPMSMVPSASRLWFTNAGAPYDCITINVGKEAIFGRREVWLPRSGQSSQAPLNQSECESFLADFIGNIRTHDMTARKIQMLASKVVVLGTETFIHVLKNPTKRKRLLSEFTSRSGEGRNRLVQQLMAVAPVCEASSQELAEVFEAIMPDLKEYEELVEWLVIHPNMPEKLLMSLAQQGRFTSQLSRRSGPRQLLEKIETDVAITTLLFDYYSKGSLAEFTAFVKKHRLRWGVGRQVAVRARELDGDKASIAREIFGARFAREFVQQELLESVGREPASHEFWPEFISLRG